MKPIKFKEQNVTFAKDQSEYLLLPAYKEDDGLIISCWKLTLLEVIKLLVTRKLWLQQLTFNDSLQPQRPQVENPFK